MDKGKIPIDDPPGHQAYMEVPEGQAGFAETDKPSYVSRDDVMDTLR